MALIPQFYQGISAFDPAVDDVTVKFVYGGNEVKGSKFIVRKYNSDTAAYEDVYIRDENDDPSTTFIIKKGTMTQINDSSKTIPVVSDIDNDNFVYIAVIIVYYENDEGELVYSGESDPITFRCFTKPTFEFDSDVIHEGSVVRKSSKELEISYSQNAGEALESFNIILYGYDNSVLLESGSIYDSAQTFTLTGLVEGEQYYVQATGITEYGTELSTDKIHFYCRANTTKSSVALVAENNECDGYIKLSASLNANLYTFEKGSIAAETTSNPYAPISDGKVDLTNNSITYTNSAGLTENSAYYFKFSNPVSNSELFEIIDADKTTKVSIYYYENEIEYATYQNSDSDGNPIISTDGYTIIKKTEAHFELKYDYNSILSRVFDITDKNPVWEIVIKKEQVDSENDSVCYLLEVEMN